MDQVTRVLAVTPGMEFLALVRSEQRRNAMDACGFSPVFRAFRKFIMEDELGRLDLGACAEFRPGLVGETVRLFPVPDGYSGTVADWQAIFYSADEGEAREFYNRIFGNSLYHGFVQPVAREQVEVSPRDGVVVEIVGEEVKDNDDVWPEEVVSEAWDVVVQDKLLPVVNDNPRVPGFDSFNVSGHELMRDVAGYCYLRLFSRGAQPYMVVALGSSPFGDALMRMYTAAVVYGFAAHTSHRLVGVGPRDGIAMYHIEPGEVSWKEFPLVLAGLRGARARIGAGAARAEPSWHAMYSVYNLEDRAQIGAAIVAGKATPGRWTGGDLLMHEAVMGRLGRAHTRVGPPIASGVSRPLAEKALVFLFDYMVSRHLLESRRPQVVAVGDEWADAEGIEWDMASGLLHLATGEQCGSAVRGSWFYIPEGVGVACSEFQVVAPRNGILLRVSGVVRLVVEAASGKSVAPIVYYRSGDVLSAMWDDSFGTPNTGSTAARFLYEGTVSFLRLAGAVYGDVEGEPAQENNGDWVAVNRWHVTGGVFTALPRSVGGNDVNVVVERDVGLTDPVVVAGWRFAGAQVKFSVASGVSPSVVVPRMGEESVRVTYSVVADDYCYDDGGPSGSDDFSDGL